jgi:hypothetical protein
MSSLPSSGDSRDQNAGSGTASPFLPDDAIDLRDLFARLMRGLPQIAGLALLGLVLAASGFLIYSPFQNVSTSTRVVFAFPGFEKGENPDHSKFQPDDIRAPSIIAEALKRLDLDTSSEMQGKIRSAINIDGIVPANVAKDRDRLRASGQVPPVYVPDEYIVTLDLPRKIALSRQQRMSLVHEIIAIYRENFQRTYGSVPLAFGSAFATLKDADYPEYQIILDREMQNISDYLTQLITSEANQTANQINARIAQAGSFRSPTTNFSFRDLLEQTQLFSQIRLTETLGIIRENGLSRNRHNALIKLDYYARTLQNQEERAVEEEKVIRDLLARGEARSQSYVLGIKSQAVQSRSESPLVDQGLIDSLLANDANNFLVRRALDAGLKVKRIQTEKAQVLALRESINAFVKSNEADQSALYAQVKASLSDLEIAYRALISNIQKTYADFANQQYGDAIRITDQTHSDSFVRPLLVPSVVGLFLGCAAGAGLSLLGIYIGAKRTLTA